MSTKEQHTKQFSDLLSGKTVRAVRRLDAKMPKNYLGNGKVVWTDGTVTLAEREEEKVLVPVDEQSGDLPF